MAGQSPDQDRHVRRSGDDYAQMLLALLPTGQAWPKSPGSTLERTVTGLAQYYGFVDSRAADLLEIESDPRKTVELLSDWETAWGLPDPCFQEPLTIAERQRVLVQRMTLLGAQSREWFIEVARWLGYTVRVTEHAPWMVGISQCGDTPDSEGMPRWEIGAPEIRFYWEIHVDGMRLTWFRAGAGECGVDHHLEIGLATDLECVIRRWKPAHTELIFNYSGVGVSDVSTTEFAIGLGEKAFETQFNVGFGPNMRVRASSISTPDAWMEGNVVSYASDEVSYHILTIDVDVVSEREGTFSDWSLNSLSTAQQGGSMAGTP